jgi:hypothetical protein
MKVVATHKYSTRERRILRKEVEGRTEERRKTAATRGHLASLSNFSGLLRKIVFVCLDRVDLCVTRPNIAHL